LYYLAFATSCCGHHTPRLAPATTNWLFFGSHYGHHILHSATVDCCFPPKKSNRFAGKAAVTACCGGTAVAIPPSLPPLFDCCFFPKVQKGLLEQLLSLLVVLQQLLPHHQCCLPQFIIVFPLKTPTSLLEQVAVTA